MYPVLFKIGGLAFHTYGLLVAIGIVVGFQVIRHWAKKMSLPENQIQDLVFYTVIAGFIGARLFYVLENWNNYRTDILGVFRIWEGGLVFYGGLVAGIICVLVLAKIFRINLWRLADILVTGLAIGHFFGRLGCLSAGCCYGRPAPTGLGITFTNPESLAIVGIPLYPTQLMEAVLVLLLFFLLWFILKKNVAAGITFSIYLVGYGLIRFFVEFYRGDFPRVYFWGLSLAQFISVLAIILGIGLFNYFLFRPDENKS